MVGYLICRLSSNFRDFTWTKFSGHNLLSLVLKDQKLFLSLARRVPLIGESIPNKFSVCSSKGQALQLTHALDFLSIQPLRGVDGVSIEGEDEFVPLLYQQFETMPSARPAFFSLNEDLSPSIRSRTKIAHRLKDFRRPVRIIFGDGNPYLNKGVAQKFHELFPASDLFLLPGAQHFVQMDEPEEVARLILSTPTTESK